MATGFRDPRTEHGVAFWTSRPVAWHEDRPPHHGSQLASMDLMWALAARAGDMVIETNFHPHSEYELDKLRGLGGSVVEVHCACPAEVGSPATTPGRGTRSTCRRG
jgi:hypothetical protein